jgi:hypothetical protein
VSFNLATFTLVHTLLSVVGILAGMVVVGGLMAGVRYNGWIATYLATTILTNATGFGFPFVVLMPSHILGVISLIILPFAVVALYLKHLAGGWRTTFVVITVAALYFNVFVLIVQLFRKVPAMIALAPTQKEPPFLVTHLLFLALFIVLGRAALRGFREERV